MQIKELSIQEKKEFINKLRKEINLRSIAKELKISESLVTLILNGERKDHYNLVNTCYSKIENTIKSIKVAVLYGELDDAITEVSNATKAAFRK